MICEMCVDCEYKYHCNGKQCEEEQEEEMEFINFKCNNYYPEIKQ